MKQFSKLETTQTERIDIMQKEYVHKSELKYHHKDSIKELLDERGKVEFFHNENWIVIEAQRDLATQKDFYKVDINSTKFLQFTDFEKMYRDIDCKPVSKSMLNRIVSDGVVAFDKTIAEHIKHYSEILDPPIEQLVGLTRVLDYARELYVPSLELEGNRERTFSARVDIINLIEAVYTYKGQEKPAYEILKDISYDSMKSAMNYLQGLIDNE